MRRRSFEVWVWGMEMAIERRLTVDKQIKLTTKDESGVDDGQPAEGPDTARLAGIVDGTTF
jgi:hypothetical protein